MALADHEGTLLWVCGTPEKLRQAELARLLPPPPTPEYGVRFMIRSRLFTDEETAAAGPKVQR